MSFLVNLADSTVSYLRDSIVNVGYGPFTSLARSAVLSGLTRIKIGQIRIETSDGVYIFPPSSDDSTVPSSVVTPTSFTSTAYNGGPKVAIKVLSDAFWVRLVTSGDLGMAEAFMAGDVEVDDLSALFKIFIINKPKQLASSASSSSVSGVSSLPSKALSLASSFTNARMFANSLTNSRNNIASHYDLSNAMFSAFLSPDMTYSSGIFPSLDADLAPPSSHPLHFPADITPNAHGHLNPSTTASYSSVLKKFQTNGSPQVNGSSGVYAGNGSFENGWKNSEGKDELEEAQLAKLRYIIQKAKIRAGHRVLEIGTGWGSFSIEAVRSTGCTVETLTLSVQQAALARERIAEAGLSDSITVHLLDYRAIPESWYGSFDRVVSIEMIEAVGKEYMTGYFEMINKALNSQGAAVLQGITIPESRFQQYQQHVDFIRKWIFPGGFLASFTFMTEAATMGSNSQLVIDEVTNIGPHYARTLRTWRARFQAAFDRGDIKRALLSEHPEMDEAGLEVFRRKWDYYFVYCAMGFQERILGVHIVRFTKEGNTSLGVDTFAK